MMGLLAKEKRKHDENRPQPPRMVMIIIAVVIIVIGVLMLLSTRMGQSTTTITGDTSEISITASAIVERATSTALGTPMAIVQPQSQAGIDPLQVTATYIIEQATVQAGAPGS